jgi:hypothetical protein
VWLVFLSLIHLTAAPASSQVSREYQLKAVFLWRLAQFTQWPADSFENADSPIIVCVLGENPFGDALDAAVRDETAHGRRLVARYHRGLDQVKMCHIVYIAGSVARQTKEIIVGVSGRSILTVSDIEGFTRSFNGMVLVRSGARPAPGLEDRTRRRIDCDATRVFTYPVTLIACENLRSPR